MSKSEKQQFYSELSVAPLIRPSEIEVTDNDGVSKTFLLGHLDAIIGREVFASYPIAMLPKIGEYRISEDMSFLLMAHVAVKQDNGMPPVRITSRVLLNNHIIDSVQLLQLEWAMIQKNFSFFFGGKTQNLLEILAEKFQQKILEMLMGSSATSSETNSPATMSSEQNIA